METKWIDINDVPYINGWHCSRSTVMNVDGVGTLITLVLHDSDKNLYQFVLPIEVAQRVGWDLMGEGFGFFAELADMHIDEDDDDV